MTTAERSFDTIKRKMITARMEFKSQLAKLDHDELTKQVDENEWSPLQLAYHIYITDELALEQIRQVQNEDNPLLADILEIAPRLTREAELSLSLDEILAGMAARREKLFEYLSSLPPGSWEHPLQQPTLGEMRLWQFVDVLPQHELQHAQQLANIKARLQEQKSE